MVLYSSVGGADCQAINGGLLSGHIVCDWRQLWGRTQFYFKIYTLAAYMIPISWNLDICKYFFIYLKNQSCFSLQNCNFWISTFFLYFG